MKNYEKYEDEIREYKGASFCIDFVLPKIIKSNDCDGKCDKCRMLQTIWLMKDYEEPKVDWSKVKIDTPILVRDYEDIEWAKKYFAKYEDGKIYAWDSGRTSWTAYNNSSVTSWEYAKLAESEE